MDQVTMDDAERWLEIARVMSFGAPAIEERAAHIQAETTDTKSDGEAEMIEAPTPIETMEPRSARVLSIAELRQRLGIEQRTPAAAPAPPMEGRPRIVRRRNVDAPPQMAAG